MVRGLQLHNFFLIYANPTDPPKTQDILETL